MVKKKDTSIFIELLKERYCLWQIKCKEYKNKVLRDMAIKAITEEMAKHIAGIGQDDIRKKINTLRGSSQRKWSKLSNFCFLL